VGVVAECAFLGPAGIDVGEGKCAASDFSPHSP
jgi:hypothetical protein